MWRGFCDMGGGTRDNRGGNRVVYVGAVWCDMYIYIYIYIVYIE